MQSNEDHSSNIVTADDHRNISAPDETTPPTQSGRELSSPYKYCRYFFPRCFGLIGYFLFLLVEVVTFILRITYFWLTVIPLYSWKVKCAKDLTHGGQASNETSPDFYLSLPVTKLFNQSSREMFHVFIIAFKSIENIKLLYFSVIVGTLRFVNFSRVLKRLIYIAKFWTLILFLMLNLSSDLISITLEVLKDECNGKHGSFTKLSIAGIVIEMLNVCTMMIVVPVPN